MDDIIYLRWKLIEYTMNINYYENSKSLIAIYSD